MERRHMMRGKQFYDMYVISSWKEAKNKNHQKNKIRLDLTIPLVITFFCRGCNYCMPFRKASYNWTMEVAEATSPLLHRTMEVGNTSELTPRGL